MSRNHLFIFSAIKLMMALAFVVGIGLQFLVIEVPAVRAVFSTANLTGNEWIITAICSVLPLIIHEIVAIGYSICSKNLNKLVVKWAQFLLNPFLIPIS